MASFTVHLPPVTEPRQRISEAVLVKDGFSRAAFAFGSFWLFSKRLWISALLYSLALLGIWSLPLLQPALFGLSFGLTLLLAALLGLEGSSLQRWRLRRRGWQEATVVSARTEEEAERRFFDSAGDELALRAANPPARPAAPDSSVIGLFPEPGARG